MFDRQAYEQARRTNAARQVADPELTDASRAWIAASDRYGYAYQWTWMGLPVVQMPQDLMTLQEIIVRTRPEFVIETGVAWGGSVAFIASVLEALGHGQVIGIDTVLPESNIAAIRSAPGGGRVHLLRGSSIDPAIVAQVERLVGPSRQVLVCLDSNHTHAHVLAELNAYEALVGPGQMIVVGDTIVEFIPPQTHRPRPWGPGNNPMTALRAFVAQHPTIVPDDYYNQRSLISFNPGGYLRRVDSEAAHG